MYNHFAGIYDELTENVSYSERAEYISGFFHKYSVKRGAKILDLACGTGSFTAEFSRLGYDVTGADISCEMLSVAENKCAVMQALFALICVILRFPSLLTHAFAP